MKPLTWQHMLGVLGLLLLLFGSAFGLFAAPPEMHMGDVSRIFYVHVPTAMVALLVYTLACAFAVLSLWTSAPQWDARTAAALETGMVLNVIMLATGMFWARPTWGIWWDWDVRLTTSLLALVLFAGVLALRAAVSDPRRRATWTAVTTIVAYTDVPLIYFCVRWWRSLHQVQSSLETVDAQMLLPFRVNTLGVLLLALWFISIRARVESLREASEAAPEPAPLATTVTAS